MAKQSHYYKLFSNPPEDPTYDQLMKWLVDTGWVPGRVRKIISSLDLKYLDDYIQEVWEQILIVPQEKIMSIWKKGKGKFCNYIKSIISNQIISTESRLYKHLRKGRLDEIYLDDVGWALLDNEGEADYIESIPQFRDECLFKTKSMEFGYYPSHISMDSDSIPLESDELDMSSDHNNYIYSINKKAAPTYSDKYIKKKGKSIPIFLSSSTQRCIQRFKDRLLEMSENDEVDERDKLIIQYIIHDMDEYDSSLYIMYYDTAHQSSTVLGRIFKVSPSVASSKIKNIKNQLETVLTRDLFKTI